MSLGIRQKLIIAFASTSLLITGIAFVAMLFSFRAGFLQYVNDHRYQSLEQLQQVLIDSIVTERDWQALTHRRREWDESIRYMLQNNTQSGFIIQQRPNTKKPPSPPPSHAEVGTSESAFRRPLSPPRNRRPSRQPFVLFDSQQQVIYGQAKTIESMWLLPIHIQHRVVGYVGLDKLTHFTSDAEHVFVADQTRYFIWIAIAASLLALAVAFVLARWMVVPIQRLDKAMSALMRRDYNANVQYQSKDEIGRLVSSFNQLAKALGEYDRTQQQWIADISHELRTPLATLRGEVEAIQEGVRTFTTQRLDSLHEEVLRLQRIVDDLHQLSLSDAGSMRYAFDPVLVRGIIRQVLARNHRILHQHHLCHELIVTGDEHAVYGDADRLAQLFYNLLQNSLRYTDSGGQLRITIRYNNNHTVDIIWEDSEPGVLSSSLDKLFDRLYREEKSRNREKGGSGLGLSICRSIVEAHQGEVVARQSPLGGVAIAITLPLINAQ